MKSASALQVTVCLIVFGGFGATGLRAQVPWRAIALTGQDAADTPADVTYASFQAPVIDASGGVAFEAWLAGPGVDTSNERGIWSAGSGNLSLVAREGSTAPGTSTTYKSFNDLVMNGAGRVAFSAQLNASSAADRGIWSQAGTGIVGLVSREGEHAPDTPPGSDFGSMYRLAYNDTGQTAFHSFLRRVPPVDSTNDSGIWSDRAGSLGLLAREGSPAPGVPAGVVFSSLDDPVLSSGAQVAFRGYVTGDGVDTSNDSGVWGDRSGTLGLLAREGSPADGTAAGVDFAGFGHVDMNRAGRVAFRGWLRGDGIDGTNDTGIWSDASGSLAVVARDGQHAPGTADGVDFSISYIDPVINDAGHTAFYSGLTGPGVEAANGAGIWKEDGDGLSLVMRFGDHAPGTPDGVSFTDAGPESINNAYDPIMNAEGQVAFFGVLTGSDVDLTNSEGIWGTDLSGLLRLVARTGDPFEVAPGDIRTIGDLQLITGAGGGDGHATSFSPAGELAFLVEFTDGSAGIFVATIPEPATLGLVLLGIFQIRRRRP